ncbi:MAG: Asp-tRNA(Asn)/Glu-tRNA(Gln) amidotransferase subunit GatC [Myxococcaceae bacterium]|nr:Asp-tRNA(Asn)/Glu-tRNA(Gln) amidotransferase subunit GatC [Myxococcaceae bacterium]
MALTLEQVRHVAALARLALTPDEERACQQQLSVILDAMEVLSRVDTEGVEPTTSATFAEGALRPDVVQPSLGAEKAVANAPAKAGTSFAVPKILD